MLETILQHFTDGRVINKRTGSIIISLSCRNLDIKVSTFT